MRDTPGPFKIKPPHNADLVDIRCIPLFERKACVRNVYHEGSRYDVVFSPSMRVIADSDCIVTAR